MTEACLEIPSLCLNRPIRHFERPILHLKRTNNQFEMTKTSDIHEVNNDNDEHDSHSGLANGSLLRLVNDSCLGLASGSNGDDSNDGDGNFRGNQELRNLKARIRPLTLPRRGLNEKDCMRMLMIRDGDVVLEDKNDEDDEDNAHGGRDDGHGDRGTNSSDYSRHNQRSTKLNLQSLTVQTDEINTACWFTRPDNDINNDEDNESRSQPFSEGFYDRIDKFLDDQNLYIIDPSCFHQPYGYNKKLMSLNRFQSGFGSMKNTVPEIEMTSPSTKNLNDSPLLIKTPGIKANFQSSSLLKRRLERNHDNSTTIAYIKDWDQEPRSAMSLPSLDLDETSRESRKQVLIGSNSYTYGIMDSFGEVMERMC